MINRIEKLTGVIYKQGEECLARVVLESQAKINELIDHLKESSKVNDGNFIEVERKINRLQSQIDDLKLGCRVDGVLHKQVNELTEELQYVKRNVFDAKDWSVEKEEEKHMEQEKSISMDAIIRAAWKSIDEEIVGTKCNRCPSRNVCTPERCLMMEMISDKEPSLTVNDMEKGCWYLIEYDSGNIYVLRFKNHKSNLYFDAEYINTIKHCDGNVAIGLHYLSTSPEAFGIKSIKKLE